MRFPEIGEENCSIARTLAVLGERWTLLILRQSFLGVKRFDELQRTLGIARNVL
ncbi:MAG TPA: winged helix-turn-helix transcriptional regulator, partial [Solirubrobacteraceae bacterium]|nr:winged helix-turn-helix transcriptional regulator [Solirubrobacteraceae bacterium]